MGIDTNIGVIVALLTTEKLTTARGRSPQAAVSFPVVNKATITEIEISNSTMVKPNQCWIHTCCQCKYVYMFKIVPKFSWGHVTCFSLEYV